MIKNSYATVKNFLDWIRTESPVDTPDDRIIEYLLSSASRHIDRRTSRRFFPLVATRLYDIPDDEDLLLDDDLLALTTLTNGNSTVITASDYILPSTRNGAPYHKISLRDTSSLSWELSSTSSAQQVISVLGTWGYRHYYASEGWEVVTTLGAALTDTTGTALTLTTTYSVNPGDLLRIDSELCHVTAITSGTVGTIARGDNGSTAATHLNGATVYRWVYEPDIHHACLEIANAAYKRRFGENVSSAAQVTGAGVVITPQDIPSGARALYEPYKRIIG